MEHMSSAGHLKLPENSKDSWDQPTYFFPTYENDNLLCFLDDEVYDSEAVKPPIEAEEIPVETVQESILKEKEFRDSISTRQRREFPPK